jgi:alkylhydroperoxidase family enzyme
MHAQIPERVQRLVTRILEGAAVAAAELRRAAYTRGVASVTGGEPPVEERFRSWVEMVALRAASIGQAELDALRAAGADDEEIYDVTIATAVGAAVARFERGLALLEAQAPPAAAKGVG